MGLVDLYRTWAQIQEQNRLKSQQDAGANWLRNYETAATPEEKSLRLSQLPNVLTDPATAEQFERRALTRDQLRLQGDQVAKAKQLEDFLVKAQDFYGPSQSQATRGQLPTPTEARQDLLAFGRDQGVSPLVVDQAAKSLESFLRPKTKFENVGGTLYGLDEERGTVGIPEGFQAPAVDPLKDMPADYRAFLVSNQMEPSPQSYAAYNAGELERRRASAPSVNVGVNTEKRQSAVVDSMLKDIDKNYQQAQSDAGAINRIDRALDIVKKSGNSVTGLSGAVKAAVAPYATAVGLNTESMNDAEILRTLLDTNAGSLRLEIVGPGPVSNYEQGILQSVSGKKISAAQGVKQLLEWNRRQKERSVKTFNSRKQSAGKIEGYQDINQIYPDVTYGQDSTTDAIQWD